MLRPASAPLPAALLAVWLVPSLALAVPKTVVAKVDSATITAADVAAYATSRGIAPDAATHELVDVALLAREGERLGLGKSPEVAARMDAERRRAALEVFIDKEISSGLKISDAELRDMFHAQADRAKVQTIILPMSDQAQAAFDRLSKGGDFAAEAKSSYDPNASEKGGEVGWRLRGQFEKPMQEAVFSAKVGELGGPVQLALGWAVFRVQERELGDEADFQARLPDIRAFAQQQAKEKARSHYLMLLRNQFHVVLDEESIKATGTRVLPQGDEATHPVATVAGKAVTLGDVLAELRRTFGGAVGGHASGPAVKNELAWSLIDAALLEHEATARGWNRDPSVAAAAARFRPRALAQVVIDETIRGKDEATAMAALQSRVEGLRAHAHISIDDKAVAALMTHP